MKTLIFILLVLAGIVILPDSSVANFVLSHIPVTGDGEEAMNNLDTLILLMKLLMSSTGTAVLWWLWRLIRNRQKSDAE